MLLARIYETLPLVCPFCQSQMRIIAFITEGNSVREILDHIGESTLPPKVAQAHRRVGDDLQWDSVEFDQRVAW